MSPTINLNRKSLALLIAIVCSGSAQGEEYYFDPALLQGATYGQNIARFNERQTPSGDYLADVYVNGTLVTSSTNIRFNAVKEGQQTEPCLPLSVMKAAQIKSLPATDAATECRPLREWVPHAGWQFDSATLRLLLTIPMTELTHKPRGYISPSEWDSGALALFLRHNTNWTHTENTDSHYRYQYLWSGLNMGVNLGLWQVRHQSNLRYANSNQSGSAWRYNSVRTWVQRPVASVNSILSLGDSYTDSSLFGSLSFNGAKLVTDERMRPQGKRGYAPEVRGVAASSAHVVVKQLGKVIYETNVPPGPFYIDDLYNTRYQGDLEVEVIEASGKTSRFTVPYSSVPDSVRPGNWHYSLPSAGFVSTTILKIVSLRERSSTALITPLPSTSVHELRSVTRHGWRAASGPPVWARSALTPPGRMRAQSITIANKAGARNSVTAKRLPPALTWYWRLIVIQPTAFAIFRTCSAYAGKQKRGLITTPTRCISAIACPRR